MWRVFFIVTFFVASDANAFCIQSRGYDFTSSVDGAVKWLACLHDEQTQRLNEQADAINIMRSTVANFDRRIGQNSLSIMDAMQEHQPLENDIVRNRLNLEDLKKQVSDLKKTVEALEHKIASLEAR